VDQVHLSETLLCRYFTERAVALRLVAVALENTSVVFRDLDEVATLSTVEAERLVVEAVVVATERVA
jgi:hypothetical protein